MTHPDLDVPHTPLECWGLRFRPHEDPSKDPRPFWVLETALQGVESATLHRVAGDCRDSDGHTRKRMVWQLEAHWSPGRPDEHTQGLWLEHSLETLAIYLGHFGGIPLPQWPIGQPGPEPPFWQAGNVAYLPGLPRTPWIMLAGHPSLARADEVVVGPTLREVLDSARGDLSRTHQGNLVLLHHALNALHSTQTKLRWLAQQLP